MIPFIGSRGAERRSTDTYLNDYGVDRDLLPNSGHPIEATFVCSYPLAIGFSEYECSALHIHRAAAYSRPNQFKREDSKAMVIVETDFSKD
jgi:hypothetical protein